MSVWGSSWGASFGDAFGPISESNLRGVTRGESSLSGHLAAGHTETLIVGDGVLVAISRRDVSFVGSLSGTAVGSSESSGALVGRIDPVSISATGFGTALASGRVRGRETVLHLSAKASGSSISICKARANIDDEMLWLLLAA
jgi:hypothetical protein